MLFNFKQINLKKYLIHILLIVFLFAVLYFLRSRFVKEVLVELPQFIKKPRIDFNLLDAHKNFLEILQPFNEIPKFEGERGRENPFSPY